jgi:hypothetical protein
MDKTYNYMQVFSGYASGYYVDIPYGYLCISRIEICMDMQSGDWICMDTLMDNIMDNAEI